MHAIEQLWSGMHDGLVFANLVDFDTQHGHRRDVDGYARALVEFDTWLGDFLAEIEKEDLLIITADHGNDPTFRGTDHTREEVPLLVKIGDRCEPLGIRQTFADVAATLARFFHLKENWPVGTPFFTFDPRQPRHFKTRVHGV
jgi:phosphopentomutase